MNEFLQWPPQTPLEVFIVFVPLWCVMCLLLSFVSGWRSLAENYRLEERFEGPRWYFRSASFRRFVNYGGVLTLGANDRGLYLSVMLPFRIGHPALLIPWQHVRRARTSFPTIFNIPLDLGADSPVRMTIRKSLVQRMEKIIGRQLPVAE